MDAIYPDDALMFFLERMTSLDVVYHLYANDIDPDWDTLVGDLVEVAGAGYASQTVEPADWAIGSVTDRVGTLIADQLDFTPVGGSWLVYGYYATDDTGTILLQIGRFGNAPITQPAGVALPVFPVVSNYSQFPVDE